MVDSEQTADAEVAETPAPGAGATLRSARESRGLSVEEVSTDLRIESHLLQALEGEDYAKLGAPVFAKGYIRQYAARLGLDPAPLVASYLDATGHADVRVQPSRVIRLRDGQHYTISILAVLSFVLVVVFLLVWWFREPATGGVDRTTGVPGAEPRALPFPEVDRTSPPAGPLPEPIVPAAEPVGGPAAAGPGPGAVAVPPDVSPAGVARDAGVATAAGQDGVAAGEPDAPVAPTAGAATAAGGAAPPGGAAAGAAANAGSPAVEPTLADGPVLDIVFIDDCWVEITDADGRRLLYGLESAGTRREVAGPAPLEVILGNADAAQIRIDGRDFTVPAASRRGNLARFVIPASTN